MNELKNSVTRLTDEELETFIQDFLDDKIFTSAHIHPDKVAQLLGLIFVPIGLGALKAYTEEEARNIGVIFEYKHLAKPEPSPLGTPIFITANVLHIEDWRTVARRVTEVRQGHHD